MMTPTTLNHLSEILRWMEIRNMSVTVKGREIGFAMLGAEKCGCLRFSHGGWAGETIVPAYAVDSIVLGGQKFVREQAKETGNERGA